LIQPNYLVSETPGPAPGVFISGVTFLRLYSAQTSTIEENADNNQPQEAPMSRKRTHLHDVSF
jgi:hypothetical protein